MTQMYYDQRKDLGDKFERAVSGKLTELGWIVQPFGSVAFSYEFRRAMQAIVPPATERWLPDFLVVKANRIVVVDAKGGKKWEKTNNHDIEAASVESMRRYCEAYGREGIFVFSDWRCCTWQIALDAELFPEDRSGYYRGSGTAFRLIRNRMVSCRAVEDVFK